MIDTTNEMDTPNDLNRIAWGRVTKVAPFAAYLRLQDRKGMAYLHISQVSADRVPPPLSDTLKEGDPIEVFVKWFDHGHDRWEVSHKVLEQTRRWNSSPLSKSNTALRARVLRSSELGAVLDLDILTATISPNPKVIRDCYAVFYSAGLLKPGEFIDVVQSGWDEVRGKPLLMFYVGDPPSHSFGELCDGVVIHIDTERFWGKDELHDDLYAKLPGGETVRVISKDVSGIDRYFPVGTTVPLSLGKYKPFLQMFEALIDWTRTDAPAPSSPVVGAAVDVKITRTLAHGALCLISDRVLGMVASSTIVKEKDGDARRYLRPGDVVRAVVERSEGPKRNELRFLKLVDRTINEDASEGSELIDLRASRRLGSASGFERDQSFRYNVLGAFDHTCCVCGERHVFGSASAMEAAHIIPRARRGADVAENGLCLCALHHWAFDKGFWTIGEDHCIVVAQQIMNLGDPDSLIARYHGKTIQMADPTIVSSNALQWHRTNVFLDEDA
jgi:predicted RNA-binding protein with RPS1 domain